MPIYKASMLWEVGESGWSESYYRNANTHEGVFDAMEGPFLAKRLAMCGSNVTLQAVRISDPDPPRDSLLVTLNAKPLTGLRADMPGAGVHVRLTADASCRREQIFRGPPDDWLFFDEVKDRFTFNSVWLAAWNAFRGQLLDKQWLLRCLSGVGAAAPKQVINVIPGIGATAIVSCSAAHGLAVGQYVRLRGIVGRIAPFGPKIRRPTGRFQILTVPDVARLTVGYSLPTDYTYDHGGTVSLEVYTYLEITHSYPREPRFHRTGRSFFVPLGRRSVRRY